MRRIGAALGMGALGALLSGLLSFAIFLTSALFEGSRPDGAVAFAIVFSIAPAVVGAFVGVSVYLLRPSILGGVTIGIVGTALLILFWTLLTSGNRGFMLSLAEASRFLGVFAATPLALAGLITAWIRHRRERNRASLTPGQPV